MVYNLTNMGNQSGIVPMIQQVNTELMRSQLGIMFLISLALITFMGFFAKTNNGKQSITATSFICFIASILLRAMELVPDTAWVVSLIAVAVSTAMLYVAR